jgi:acetolactate decarboxylase
MRMSRPVAIALLLVCLCCGFAGATEHVLYQVSTINALMQGIYDGPTTIGALLAQGDFGIGTFTGLEGEMVVLDGKCYQVRSDSLVGEVPETTTTPFAAVTSFTEDMSFPVMEPLSLEELEQVIDARLPTRNMFYALKVVGEFSAISTRSVPRQQPPYLPLTEVVKRQSVFEMRGVQGTIVGLRCPDYVAGINVPGYHLHFLRADRQAGGHVLEGIINSGTVSVSVLSTFTLVLPGDAAFAAADLTRTTPAEVQAVER